MHQHKISLERTQYEHYIDGATKRTCNNMCKSKQTILETKNPIQYPNLSDTIKKKTVDISTCAYYFANDNRESFCIHRCNSQQNKKSLTLCTAVVVNQPLSHQRINKSKHLYRKTLRCPSTQKNTKSIKFSPSICTPN